MNDLAGIGSRALKELVARGLRTVRRWLLYMLLAAGAVSAVAFAIASQGSVARGVLAALLAFLVCSVIGVILVIRWIVAWTILEAVRQVNLTGWVLDRMFEAAGSSRPAETLQVPARSLEVPLAEAEQGLDQATTALTHQPVGESGITGRLLGRAQGQLVPLVGFLTRTRLREVASPDGRIDLARARNEMKGWMARKVEDRLLRALRITTVLLVLLALALSLLIAFAVRGTPSP